MTPTNLQYCTSNHQSTSRITQATGANLQQSVNCSNNSVSNQSKAASTMRVRIRRLRSSSRLQWRSSKSQPRPLSGFHRHHSRRSLKVICFNLVLVSIVSLVISSQVSCIPNQQQQPQHRTGTTDHSTDKQLLKKALDDQGNLSKSSPPLLSSSSIISNNNNNNNRQQQQQQEPQASSFVANSTAPVNFQCPEQFGYYTDTRDCTKYYVCVFGEVLHESCTGGLRFSRELQTCDWPRNVDCPQQQQQSGANSSSGSSTTSATILPPAQLLQLKVQAAASSAKESSSSNEEDEDEKPAAMKGSSLVFADEGTDPQQPSFDEAVSPVITPDGAIHLHDGSGGTYSLQANGAAAANAAGARNSQADGHQGNVDVFVKALSPAIAAPSTGRTRSQAASGNRQVPTSAKLLQPSAQQQHANQNRHLSVNSRPSVDQPGEQPQDSSDEQPGSGESVTGADDSLAGSPAETSDLSGANNEPSDEQGNQPPATSAESIGAQADQTELAEERNRAASSGAESERDAGADSEINSSNGDATSTTVTAATTSGYIPPVMASASPGLRSTQPATGPNRHPHHSTPQAGVGFNGLASGGGSSGNPRQNGGAFMPSFKPPSAASPQQSANVGIDSGESDDNFSGNLNEMNNQQAESRSNGRQNLLIPTGMSRLENQTTTSTTTLHQQHPHPHQQHNHHHLSINLQAHAQSQQLQNTRQSRMSNNFKPQQFTHLQTNLNQANSDMFDGQPAPGAQSGRQASGGNRFSSQASANNNDANDSAKLMRLQSSHRFDLPASSGSNHFRPSQPFPAPSAMQQTATAGRSQNGLFSQQQPSFASSSVDQRSQAGESSSLHSSPAASPFNQQQQRRPRPPKRQQIPQGTNAGSSRNKPVRGPQLSLSAGINHNNQQQSANAQVNADDPSLPMMMMIDQQQPTTTATISSQITTSAAANVMQPPGHTTSTTVAATASQFLSLPPAAPAQHHHHGNSNSLNQNHNHHQQVNNQRHQQRQPATIQPMFTTSAMDQNPSSNGQSARSSGLNANANLPSFSQQITRPIVAPTTINFQQQQDFLSTASPTATTGSGHTATTIQAGNRQRFNQHVAVDSLTNGNNRNLQIQIQNNQGQRAAHLLGGESSTERPATTSNLLITTTDGSTALGNDQDSELQIDPGATGNSVGGMRGSSMNSDRDGNGNGNGLLVNSGSDSDSHSPAGGRLTSLGTETTLADLNTNTNSNQNLAAANTATATTATATTTTTNQEQDPQLVANRYLNSAIDALEAGQPFGTVDYDFDILNDNSTDNRRNPTSSTTATATAAAQSVKPTQNSGNRTPSPSSSLAQAQAHSHLAGQQNGQSPSNGNTGLFYSNPTNANNKQRQHRPNQHSFNRQQDGIGSGSGSGNGQSQSPSLSDDGESISLTNGQPTATVSAATVAASSGVATNSANQIGLNGGVRSQQQVRANANGIGTGGRQQQNSFAPISTVAAATGAASQNQQASGSRQRGTEQLPHLSATPATPSVKDSTPTKKPRPTNKKITVNHEQALANNRASIEPAKRPEALFNTPTALQTATKCDNRACRLPDCKCGDTLTPGGLDPKVIPQVILLTFDDAVNDLNWEIYEELFTGRTNPNGCPILATFYVSHEWTDYGQVQTLYSRGHEMASHSITHSFGEKFSKNQWFKEVNGQREILNMYGGVKMNDVRGMRAPFLQIGGNKMFEMLYDANFTYDSSMPIFENSPPLWPYTLDYQMTHECMITPCPTKSFPGVWEVGMTMWVDLRGGRCSMGDACSNPADEDGVYEMLMKNFNRHYKSNRAPFGLFYHSAWFNTVHHRRGFLRFLATVNGLSDVFFVTNWQMLQWMRKPTPLSEINSFEPWQCPTKNDRPPPCYHPSVCNVKSEHGTRFMKTCQPCPTNQQYPWVGSTGFKGKQASANGSG